MSMLCKMVGHKWKNCKCARCGELRDEDHLWVGCLCYSCGKIRNEGHRWKNLSGNSGLCIRKCTLCGSFQEQPHQMVAVPGKCYTECSVCGLKTIPVHSWNGCTCSVCGEQRDEQHKWERTGCTEKCSICGKTRVNDSLHEWVREGCKEQCSICGAERESHDYQFVRRETEYGTGKCSKVYASDDYACGFCHTPEACLKYPRKDKDLYKCSRCGQEKWEVYRP